MERLDPMQMELGQPPFSQTLAELARAYEPPPMNLAVSPYDADISKFAKAATAAPGMFGMTRFASDPREDFARVLSDLADKPLRPY